MSDAADPQMLVADPAVVLAVPVEADVAVMREIIEDGYATVEDEYERGAGGGRKGSLCQELLAQLSHQEGDDE